MSYDPLPASCQFPAPCIVDMGVIVNKQDMTRLLSDLSHVRYCYRQENRLLTEDEGYVIEVFADPQRSTLVANHSLYLNVSSFDYLELKKLPDRQSCFELVQDNLRLQIMPLSNPLMHQCDRQINASDLEAVVAEVLSASWDMQLDDEEIF
jgi:hypothetical protein